MGITAGNVSAMVNSARQFITDAGVQAVATATNRSEGAVRVWKHRNRFPREAWLELSQAFPELTLDVLREIEPAGPRKASAETRAA